MTIIDSIDKHSRPLKIFLGYVFIGIVSLLDMWSGYEIGFSIFYVLPVSFISWFTGRFMGILVSLASAGAWLWMDLASGHLYSSFWIPFWNMLIRLLFFLIIALLIAALRKAINQMTNLSRIDGLTGVFNSRFFHDLAQMELDRFIRYGHIFSIAYLDLDNFKIVNDQWGHAAGDAALREVSHCIQKSIRRTDVLARLGGDEFALLLPETDLETSRKVCIKIQMGLMEAMQSKDWPVTVSIGVLTCHAAPPSVDALVRQADELMYAVKHGSKNGIQYATYEG